MEADHAFVDQIYEAGVVPERWPGVLQGLTARAKGAFASMIVLRDGKMRSVGTPEAEKLIAEFEALQDPSYNSRIARSAAHEWSGFHTDLDFFTEEEMSHDAFYRDFLRPRGYGWITGAWVRPPTGELINIGIEGHFRRGPFDASQVASLNVLFPHLARAALWSSRLDLNRAQAMTQALQSVGLAAAALQSGGRLYAANSLFDKLMPAVVTDRRNRICLTDVAADALLADTIARLGVKNALGQSRSIAVAGKEDSLPMIFHVLPVRGVANDIFSHSIALLVVTPVDRNAVPTAEVLQGLFDLTPAEARVARGIAEGKAVEAIATASGLSRETIRAQLAAVFGKMGVNRQAELVSLLGGKTFP